MSALLFFFFSFPVRPRGNVVKTISQRHKSQSSCGHSEDWGRDNSTSSWSWKGPERKQEAWKRPNRYKSESRESLWMKESFFTVEWGATGHNRKPEEEVGWVQRKHTVEEYERRAETPALLWVADDGDECHGRIPCPWVSEPGNSLRKNDFLERCDFFV